MNTIKRVLATVLAALLLSTVGAGASSALQPGFIVPAEDRFDPAIQRLIAEHSLRALPLERGRLYYYFYPVGPAPRFEGAQIRYLETLLEKAARDAEEEKSNEE